MGWDREFPLGVKAVRQRTLLLSLLAAVLVVRPALAQDEPGGEPPQSPQPSAATPHEHGQDPHAGHSMAGMNMVDMTPVSMYLMNVASGTSVNPASWPMPSVMTHFGSWNTMFMGAGFVMDTQQSGPRGGDKLYSANWFMASAEHRVGVKGAFQFDLMLSLDPATITGERYPLLFQTGETAYGKPLVDAQHPHNFIMGLGFHYAYQPTDDITVDAYFAPVGDPALGPIAFPHRASAMELPQAPLSHHWQDSTHVAYEVLTVGISHKKVRLEASGFYGSEPGENRWIIQSGPMNSWASRLWFFPTRNWAAQISVGRIAHPEALAAGDQVRATASLEYTKPLPGGSWSSSLIWGRNHSTATLRNLNSYLVESVLPLTRRNLLTGRVELVGKDELFNGQPDIEQRLDHLYGSTFRIGACTIGYTRDISLFRYVETGIGANFSSYSLPGAIKPYYGNHPLGGNLFIRFRLRR